MITSRKGTTYLRVVLIFLSTVSVISCDKNFNYRDAKKINYQGKTHLVLKQERKVMPHKISDILLNKTYTDSIVIDISSLKNDTVYGKNMPIRRYSYKKLGFVSIKNNNVNVRLASYNTDDNTLDSLSYNGFYKINN